MEENSEAHMETDVSSTTADVPEVQEVTGSQNQIETVILVEEIKEERNLEVDLKTQGAKQRTLQDDKKSASNEPSQSFDKSPQKNIEKLTNKDGQTQKSPIKDGQLQKSPTKDVPEQKSPLKEGPPINSSQKTPTKHDQVHKSSNIIVSPINKAVQPPTELQHLKENADSSSTVEVQNSPTKLNEKGLQKLPPTTSEAQKTDTNSPQKETTHKSPVKENQIQENIKVTSVKPSQAPITSNEGDNNEIHGLNEVDSSKQDEEITSVSLDITCEIEASNDSQMETNFDISEKEHNKSISRELKSLINSAKESKIISECTQLTSKTRKSRSGLDSSNTNLNTSVEADKIQGRRRGSNISLKSNSSEKSEKATLKRSMRSQNPEFVNKVKQFLNSVTGKGQKHESGEINLLDEEVEEINKNDEPNDSSNTPKRKKQEPLVQEKGNKLRSDLYCWRCHWAVEQTTNEKAPHPSMHCTVCPRSFHYKCLSGSERSKTNPERSWVCPECLTILHAESSETRSQAMKKISLGMLCELLKHALERMMDLNGVEPFMQPVDRAAFPDYDKYVVHPMDLSLMKANIDEGLYGSTEAFLADAQWILHNSIIFNTMQSKLTAGARALVRSCRAEMSEIEACPECYAAAHARRPTWFTDVCSTPHMLLWAKLKGFPYWPAKGMSVSNAGLVDVRFFGAHDRAWVPARDCFLYSERDPNNFRTKRQDILDSMQEAEHHIRNISRKYGKFVYPPFKSPFDPSKLNEQLKMMIPSFEGEVRTTMKEKQSSTSPNMPKEKRSNSKSCKDSFNDGETSEGEDMAVKPRKMEDGAEIAKEDEDVTGDMDKTVDPSQAKENESPKKPSDSKEKDMEVDMPQIKETETSRKRRRSDLEEAVITIMDTAVVEKRKRIEVNNDKVQATKPQSQDTNVGKETEAKPMKEDEEPEKDATSSKKIEVVKLTSIEQTEKTTPKLTPIKIITVPRTNKQTPKVNTPKYSEKILVQKAKPVRRDKSSSNEKDISQEEKSKRQKQKSTKAKSSSNNNTPKADKNVNKKIENDNSSSNNKDNKQPQNNTSSKETELNKSTLEKNTSTPKQNTPRSTKDRIQFDDDITLADIAREASKNVDTPDTARLPTISSVRSLSTTTQNTDTNKTKNITTPKPSEKIIEASSDSSIFTPTSTDNVRNMKEAVNKLQKLRSDTDQPVVGRVGVRSFARMVSPQHTPNTVEVEIKTEPIDFDDADRQVEKMNLMKAFKLRPVNAPGVNLRDVRINRVVTTPATRKSPSKPPEVRVRAKKTFPQPKKADEPRSELISKNSMVYIPIQPPMTQAPVKVPSRSQTNGPATSSPGSRPSASVATSTSTNSLVNTVAPPLVPVPLSSALLAPAPISSTLPTVPTTVHTVPLITSVNGQWTFSLQPVMSVGSVDGTPSPPMVNGIAERSNSTSGFLPTVTPGPTVPTVGPALQPAVSTPMSTATNTVAIITNSTNPIPTSTSTPASVSTVPNRTSDNAPGEPPRLQQRPLLHPMDANTPIGGVPPPSTAGPITAKLNQNAVKLTDFFRNLIEDSIEKLDEPQAQVTALRSQLEQTRWRHQQEIAEITHNHELVLAEMRMSFEKEKTRVVSEMRKTAQAELDAAIKHTKSKQWCANCSQEAQFYCCWNTSYCDYPCQRAHWTQHYAVCTQQRNTDNGNNREGALSAKESRLQSPPENLPALQKSTSTPTLTVGGKVATSRVFGHDSQKTSIIVSMVEDTSGNQVMKCVGTYKAPASPQTSPLIINKQLLNSEDGSAKKVVTSGGYLIVGASGNQTATSVVASTRRPNTIQYFT